jgi:MerR family transcriptional regulator, light-induced transcriptional regulator
MTVSTGSDGLSIAAISDLLEIPIPTIRSWERRYGFPAPARTRGGHRRYSADEVEQVRALRDAITQGRSARDAVTFLRRRAADETPRDHRVDELLRAAIDLSPGPVRSVLEGLEEDPGLEPAIVDVVLPAMHEIGARWKAGVCDVATEHALTDTVRRWLARWTTLTSTADRPPIVLSSGPKEMHTVGLEAFGLLLARRGWPVLVLGALTPADALRRAVVDASAAGAVVTAQRGIERRRTVASIVSIHPLLGRRTFYAGSAFATPVARRGVPGVYLGVDLLAAADLVEASISDRSGAITGAG